MHRRRSRRISRAPLLAWLACSVASITVSRAQVTETVLHSFVSPPGGASPSAGLVADSSGNLYGTTTSGGTGDQGVVFKLSTSGTLTVLHDFTGGADGGTPFGGLLRDSAGNLYGTASIGGAYDAGVVYEINTAGQETVLYSFTGETDGGSPYCTLIQDSSGNLYGTTLSGGTGYAGVVFKLDTAGQETVLYNFTNGADGGFPHAGVVMDTAGNLYGTTYQGGTNGTGTVYEVSSSGQETVLYTFLNGVGGGYPDAGVIRDSSNNLYGTASTGGSGFGVVYEVSSSQETVLYTFTGGADGGRPQAGLIRESSGTLYGTASTGGAASAGVVFSLNTSGQESVIYSFAGGTDGKSPRAGLIRNSSGTLFGTTYAGDSVNLGVVYKVTAAGQETLLYSFKSNGDGRLPWAGVVLDTSGNLYGTSSEGGTGNAGIVYKVSASGEETILYNFTGGADGGYPYGGVVLDSDGNLYGTTSAGGASGLGAVFEVTPAGQETVLYSFKGGTTDGEEPYAGVVRDSDGNLYGTTLFGGTYFWGTVFKVSATGAETVLHNFGNGEDGRLPYAGVIRDSSGNLYGTTQQGGSSGNDGTIYKLSSSGEETVLWRFNGFILSPTGGLARDSAGNLYGTCQGGGSVGDLGEVFKLSTAGKMTSLFVFAEGEDGSYPDGADPYAGVTLDANDNVYGTTTVGGTDNWGVVYKIDTSGQETLLYSFTDGDDGGYPYSHVVLDSSGNLYATTYYGGARDGGVVFKLPGVTTAERKASSTAKP